MADELEFLKLPPKEPIREGDSVTVRGTEGVWVVGDFFEIAGRPCVHGTSNGRMYAFYMSDLTKVPKPQG